jgi:hypothetical protein
MRLGCRPRHNTLDDTAPSEPFPTPFAPCLNSPVGSSARSIPCAILYVLLEHTRHPLIDRSDKCLMLER